MATILTSLRPRQQRSSDNMNDNDNEVEAETQTPNENTAANEDPADDTTQAGSTAPQPKADKPAASKEHPQVRIDKFWLNFLPQYEGRVTKILPNTAAESSVPKVKKEVQENSSKAVNSYENARAICVKHVKRIIQECQARNQKYSDPHFDLERDLKVSGNRDCLYGLTSCDGSMNPLDVKRVTDIFEDPQFFKDGAGFDDIVQGRLGDCWLLAGLSAVTANEDLLRKICVIQDQEIGVYGFVFHRDGDWHPCIVDDKLYLSAPNFDESSETVLEQYGVRQKDQEKLYTETLQKGSKALYFASCRDENETWVPLIEKALAKAHGDYSSLAGGQVGEALEDLTGGVTTEIYTTNILNKERFWKDLRRIGQDFLFSCATAVFSTWRGVNDSYEDQVLEKRRKGIHDAHAYSVLDTYDDYGLRLVKIRNPWGSSEWTGAWSDGSKEWTAEWLTRIGHKFGDDGVFWIPYEDMLKKYKYMDRTRLFGEEWHIAQEWCSVQVPFATLDYQETKFLVDVPADTDAVIVLSQLDTRYFQGLQGQYNFVMSFRIQRYDDDDEDNYISRSAPNYELRRSTNVEIFLEKGKYTVLVKVEAFKNGEDDIEDVIRENISRREKVKQTATLYDLAYRKGRPPQDEKKAKKQEETEEAEKAKKVEETENAESKKTMPTTSDAGTNTDSDKPEEKKDEENAGSDESAAATVKKDDDDTNNTPTSTLNDKDKDEDLASNPTPPVPDDSDPNRDPWNAFCVLGLRVYSFQPELGLKVVWSGENADNEGENGEKSTGVTLDRDDIAKAPLMEAERAEAEGKGQGNA